MAVRGVIAQTLAAEVRTLHREKFGLTLTLVAVDKGEPGAGSGHVAGAAPVKMLAPDAVVACLVRAALLEEDVGMETSLPLQPVASPPDLDQAALGLSGGDVFGGGGSNK